MSVALSELLAGLSRIDSPELPISGICSDSRKVTTGQLFLACQGLQHHGLDFLASIVAARPAAIAWEPPYKADSLPLQLEGIPLLPVPQLSAHLGEIARRFYAQPTAAMRLVGVTGTDGKTSCTQFIARALETLQHPCGVLGTIGYGRPQQMQPASHTTPDALTLWAQLAALRDQGVHYLAMEVSSHALAQRRVAGLQYEVAVLTHLSRDHLDYHGTLEAYAAAKQLLFTDYAARTLVLNLDDAFGRRLAQQLQGQARIIGYGLQPPPTDWHGEWLGAQVQANLSGLQLQLHGLAGEVQLHSSLLGWFNAANLLATLATLLALGIPTASALSSIAQLSTVPGRMQRFGQPGQPTVVVDYAHTHNSLEQVLTALRAHLQGGRLLCVFGCGGERDQGKRPLMGAVAERLADVAIVTNDNPRSEVPEVIAQQILAGMQQPDAAHVELDRQRAIRYAIEQASAQDIVLIAGKGHEDYQLIGGRTLHFSDAEQVEGCLADYAHG